MIGRGETIRYDKRQDEDNDVKKHDNKKHLGKHANDKAKAEAEDKLKEGKR